VTDDRQQLIAGELNRSHLFVMSVDRRDNYPQRAVNCEQFVARQSITYIVSAVHTDAPDNMHALQICNTFRVVKLCAKFARLHTDNGDICIIKYVGQHNHAADLAAVKAITVPRLEQNGNELTLASCRPTATRDEEEIS